MSFYKKLLFVALLANSLAPFYANAKDNEGAFLNPPFKKLNHPAVTEINSSLSLSVKRSNVRKLIDAQTPVKSQQNRGTCSVFSSIAMLESMMIIKKKFPKKINLSEEWLQYVVNHKSLDDGSTSAANFSAFLKYGAASEKAMPYIGADWEDAREGKAADRCGHLRGNEQKSCLIVHRSPRLMNASEEDLKNPNSPLFDEEFLQARTEAVEFREKNLAAVKAGFTVSDDTTIKALLDQGIPVALDIEFFYGAWNHSEADELGIGRNLDHWKKGIVGYPELGSMDIVGTQKDPAGHSVLVVGYDDSIIVKTKVKMEDGTTQTFTRTGVYYIKNSWGKSDFGVDFTLAGKKYPGFGMITQDYAHEQGEFFRFPLE